MSSKALDILAVSNLFNDFFISTEQECDEQLAIKVQHERFKWHNYQWLEMTTGQAVIDDLDPYYDDSYQFPEDLNDVYDVLDMQSPLNMHYPIDQEFSGPEEYYSNQFSGPEEYYTGGAHPPYHTIGAAAGDDASYMFIHSMDSSHPLARTI